jgi:rod shape determining protein RodA
MLKRTNNSFCVFYLSGISSLIFVQTFINIGMNIGIMPVTGIPLPFISSGGSSLLSLLMALGIAQNCHIQSRSHH